MDTSSAESRDRIRRAIDDEIISSKESTRVLRSRRNAVAPISRLPPETLAAIFSFLLTEWNKNTCYLKWIRVTHVCRRWREVALGHPCFWSHICFTKLKSDGVAEIFSRAKMAPLHLEADFTTRFNWPQPMIDAIGVDIEAHISHTRRLRICGPLQSILERLASSAPTLESIFLLHKSNSSSKVVIPVNLFNCTTPSLSSLELENCDISWKSPLLKGLQTLKILRPSKEARPKLEDWLSTLDEMPQLETLVLNSATPLASLASLTSRIVTLPSLNKLYLAASAKDCFLALTHLVLPALTCLHVNVISQESEGGDVRLLIPYVAQNVSGMQDVEPFRSILIDGKRDRIEVLAWTTPDADLKFCNSKFSFRAPVPCFKFTATGSRWRGNVDTAILDAFLTHFPAASVSTLTTRNQVELSKSFWVRHAPKLSSLERASLIPTTIKGFRDMLAEDAPPDGPRLSALTKLILDDIMLTESRASDLHDMLVEREEQEVPLEYLDLRSSCATARAIELLEEDIDSEEPDETLDEVWMPIEEEEMGDWHVQGPWSRYSYDDEDEEEEEGDGIYGGNLFELFHGGGGMEY